MTIAEKILLAAKIAEAVQSKYSLTTGSQFTEESVDTMELTLTIVQAMDGI
jgi:hypothetical protein